MYLGLRKGMHNLTKRLFICLNDLLYPTLNLKRIIISIINVTIHKNISATNNFANIFLCVSY